MPPAARVSSWAPTVAVTVGTALGVGCGAAGWRVPCAVFLVLAVCGEAPMHRRNPWVAQALATSGVGLLVRTSLRITAVVAVSGVGSTSRQPTVAAGLLGAAALAAMAVLTVAGVRLRRLRTPAIETRNVPLGSLHIPPAPSAFLMSPDGWLRSLIELPLLVCGALSASTIVVLLGGAVEVAAVVLVVLLLERASRAVGRRLGAAKMLPVVQRHLDAERTEVLLYFSDTLPSLYQVQMWLTTVEQLGRPTAVVLRDRSVLRALGPTTLPILCIPSAPDLMSLDLQRVRVGLFPANVGSNIHLLREPGLVSVFVGHGDSDKNASFNPVSKAFDEVWVAGPAGRERYRRASIGVRDDQVVEVGRPQLDQVERAVVRPAGWVPTVLYAPTWEGWNSDQEYGSLHVLGPLLLRAVLDSPSPVRLIYKPHPFTGRRHARVAAAHRAMLSAIHEANVRRGFAVPVLDGPGEPAVLDLLDPADAALRSEGRSAVAVEAERSAADRALFAAAPPAAHLVVSSHGPSIYSCFDATDVLVTDISSVLTDFVVTGKPFAVCNPSHLTVAEFQHSFPSIRGGVVVDREGHGLETVLGLTTGTVPDENATMRLAHSQYLLGSFDPSATERFAQAVADASLRASERNAGRELFVRSPPEPSGQSLAEAHEHTASSPAAPSLREDAP